MESTILIAYNLLLLLAIEIESSHVGYTETDGPDTWNGTCKTGKRQSPIDIQASSVLWDTSLPRIHFANYGVTTERMFISNDGHSILVNGFDKWGRDQPYIYGGPLSSDYMLQGFHFHWGQNEGNGSEHTIGGLHYPGEIHFVHKKRGLAEDSILQTDSIVVLGIFLGLGNDPKNLQPLEGGIRQIVNIQGRTTELLSSSLMDLLPTNMETYYTYEGSLTTPGCNEVVTWIVFTDPVSVTLEQLNLFRQTIITHDKKPGINFRPTQPLNGRKIRFRPSTKVSSSTQIPVFGFVGIMLTVLIFLQEFFVE